MESKNLTLGVIGVTIGLIILASALMPVLEDATRTHKEISPLGSPLAYMEEITPETNHTMSWDQSTHKWTFDGEIVSLFAGTVLCTQDTIVRTSNFDYAQTVGLINTTVNSTAGTVLNISVSNMVLSVENVYLGTLYTETIESGFIVSPNVETDWMMKKSSQVAYVHGDSEIYGIYAMGLSTVSGVWNNGIKIVGNAFEVDISQFSPANDTTATFSNIAINATPKSGYVDVYELSSIEFDETYHGATEHITYSYFIIPASINAELDNHLSAGQIAILLAIPLIVIISIALVLVPKKY